TICEKRETTQITKRLTPACAQDERLCKNLECDQRHHEHDSNAEDKRNVNPIRKNWLHTLASDRELDLQSKRRRALSTHGENDIFGRHSCRGPFTESTLQISNQVISDRDSASEY